MITKDEALILGDRWGNSTLYHVSLRNSDGSPVRCRVNGRCKIWKTRPDDFRLPVKYGLRECFYITPSNAHEWVMDEEEAKKESEPQLSLL